MTLKSVKHFTAAHYVQKNSVSFNKINATQLLIYGCDRVDVHHCFLRSWLYRHLLVLKWRCSLRWAAVDFSGRSECFFWGGLTVIVSAFVYVRAQQCPGSCWALQPFQQHTHFSKTVFDTSILSVNNDGPTTYLTITAQQQQ